MRKLLPLLSSIVLLAAIGSHAFAESHLPRGLVGWTSATLTIYAGPLVMTKMCQAEFPASRVCTTDEVESTQVVPTLPEGGMAWLLLGTFPVPSVCNGQIATMDNTGLISCGAAASHVACCAGQPELLGDIDGNGKLDLADDALLRRFLAGELSALPG